MTDLKVQSFQDANDLAAFVRSGGMPAVVQTGGNVFPMDLATKTLVVKISTDAGSTYPTTRTHTFGNGSGTGGQLHYFMSISEVVADIIADLTFMSTDLQVMASGVELLIKTVVGGNRALKVDASSTGIGVSLLQFLSAQVGNGSITTIIAIQSSNSGGWSLFFI